MDKAPFESEGIFPDQWLRQAVDRGFIDSGEFKIPDANFQPASLDLRLGAKAYRLRCSFLPDDKTVEEKLDDQARGDGLKDTFVESVPIFETHGFGGWRLHNALWFSFLSATHFGTRMLSAQTIFRRLQTEDYRIEPTKWLRAISGFQSLLRIFLLGLFAVTYFQSRVL